MQYDSRVSTSFHVWKENGICREFTPSPRGIHYRGMSSIHDTVLEEYNEGPQIHPDNVATMKENLERFNNRQVLEAKADKKLQDTVGLTTVSLLRMIDSNSMKNCTITRSHVRNAIAIWRPSEANLKG